MFYHWNGNDSSFPVAVEGPPYFPEEKLWAALIPTTSCGMLLRVRLKEKKIFC